MRQLSKISKPIAGTARRTLPLPVAIVLSVVILATGATARVELKVDTTRGHADLLPIAIVDLAGESEVDAKIGRRIAQDIARNLERSCLLRPIDSAAFIGEPGGMAVRTRFQDWRIVNAQALVTARILPSDAGRLAVEFRLWDVSAEQ